MRLIIEGTTVLEPEVATRRGTEGRLGAVAAIAQAQAQARLSPASDTTERASEQSISTFTFLLQLPRTDLDQYGLDIVLVRYSNQFGLVTIRAFVFYPVAVKSSFLHILFAKSFTLSIIVVRDRVADQYDLGPLRSWTSTKWIKNQYKFQADTGPDYGLVRYSNQYSCRHRTSPSSDQYSNTFRTSTPSDKYDPDQHDFKLRTITARE
ncbi:hypothetical protein CIB48_g3376 [Xylaria polymorpha]|nr:hypothetical protein CIB48_g3376 [Xylaria polymorpha]